MAIHKLKTIIRAEALAPPGQQKPEEPAKPSKPELPAKPSKPAEPTKPEEPSEPAKPSKVSETSSVWDEFLKPEANTDDTLVEDAILSLVKSYLDIFKDPSPDQVSKLADALEAPVEDLQKIIELCGGPCDVSTEEPFITSTNNSQEADAFDLDNSEVAEVEDLQQAPFKATAEVVSVPDSINGEEEVDDFLLPMSSMDHDSKPVVADSTPRNTRTGIDDGAPVTEGDDLEQEALINDGVVDLNDEITDVNNRSINDDGLI